MLILVLLLMTLLKCDTNRLPDWLLQEDDAERQQQGLEEEQQEQQQQDPEPGNRRPLPRVSSIVSK
jgi:hypothetical protein